MEKLNALVAEFNQIKSAHEAGKLTEAQAVRLPALKDEIKHAQAVAEGDALIRALGQPQSKGSADGRKRVSLAAMKSAARPLAEQVAGKSAVGFEQKAVTVGGYTQSFDSGLTVSLPSRPTSILDVLPAIISDDRYFSFLRQTSRTINAGVVAEGALKPESDLNFEMVNGQLSIVAHTVSNLEEYVLLDVPALTQLISDEMTNGVGREIERLFLLGTGAAGQPLGVLNTTGVTVIPAGAANAITKVRKAITVLESMDYSADVVLFNPADWEAVELTTASGSGEFMMEGSPVDRAARRLWGVQVVASAAVPAGTAVVLNAPSVALATDANMRFHLAQPGDTFNRNRYTARAEMRMGVAVPRPSGVVKVNLAAA